MAGSEVDLKTNEKKNEKVGFVEDDENVALEKDAVEFITESEKVSSISRIQEAYPRPSDAKGERNHDDNQERHGAVSSRCKMASGLSYGYSHCYGNAEKGHWTKKEGSRRTSRTSPTVRKQEELISSGNTV